MKIVMVVGGCGFIGGHLVRRLLETKGVEVVHVYDNLSSGRFENLPLCRNVDPRIRFWKGDARDYDRLRVAMKGIDTVFHLAANPDIAKAVSEPTIDFDQGTELAKNVIEAMRVNGVRRIIYFSGSGVYGEPTSGADMFTEWHVTNEPISTYGASKLACEALISAYCHMFGITARTFRFANVVGPRQTHGVGFDFIRRLKANPTTLRVLGDGSQLKSYIHVEDVLNAVMMIVDRITDDVLGEIVRPYDVYNVSTGDALTVTQIAEMACLAMGIDPREVKLEYTGGDRGWKGDVPKIRMNCGKIHSLGWRCSKNAKDAMYCALLAMRDEIEPPSDRA